MTTTAPEPLSAEQQQAIEAMAADDPALTAALKLALKNQNERDAAVAREAVLVKQLLICADQFDYYANQNRAESPPDRIKAETNTRYAEIARRVVASSFPSATALLDEMKQSRANQRTAGTKEVCAECNDHSWRSSCKWSLYAPSDHVCKIVRAAKESPT